VIRASSAHELRDKCKSTSCTARFCRSARRDRKLAAFGPDRGPTFANIGKRRATRRREHPRARFRGKAAYEGSPEGRRRIGREQRCLISIYHRSALLLDLGPRERLSCRAERRCRCSARAPAIYSNELALVRKALSFVAYRSRSFISSTVPRALRVQALRRQAE